MNRFPLFHCVSANSLPNCSSLVVFTGLSLPGLTRDLSAKELHEYLQSAKVQKCVQQSLLTSGLQGAKAPEPGCAQQVDITCRDGRAQQTLEGDYHYHVPQRSVLPGPGQDQGRAHYGVLCGSLDGRTGGLGRH